MAKKFRDLRAKMSPASQERAAKKTQAMLEEMVLAEIRKARSFSQTQLAEILELQQPAVAKLEKRADMYISTIQRYIEAIGGELVITAKFPDSEVKITQFEDFNDNKAANY